MMAMYEKAPPRLYSAKLLGASCPGPGAEPVEARRNPALTLGKDRGAVCEHILNFRMCMWMHIHIYIYIRIYIYLYIYIYIYTYMHCICVCVRMCTYMRTSVLSRVKKGGRKGDMGRGAGDWEGWKNWKTHSTTFSTTSDLPAFNPMFKILSTVQQTFVRGCWHPKINLWVIRRLKVCCTQGSVCVTHKMSQTGRLILRERGNAQVLNPEGSRGI